MHRFILSPEALGKDRILLDKKESHHARNVLRVKLGEVVELLDGRGGRFQAVIAGFDDDRVALSVDKRLQSAAEEIEVTLALCVIKPERMEWILEKSCELGVRRWLPVLSERSVVKLSRERWKKKVERWNKIAKETCKQCGQSQIPQVCEPVLFKELVRQADGYDRIFLPTLSVPGKTLQEAFAHDKTARRILLVIGPEGDFTKMETEEALRVGAVAVSLGPRVLRSETAALYTLAATQFFYFSSS